MSGVTALHLSTAGGSRAFDVAFDLLQEATFTATLPRPPGERTLLFFQRARKLAGHLVLRSNTQGPVQVQMEPYATLTGRVLDADGRPVPHASVSLCRPTALRHAFNSFDFETGRDWTEFKTDDDGRFRLEGIAPGLVFDMEIHARQGKNVDAIRMTHKGITLQTGEVKDLGDLRAAPRQMRTKS